MITIDEFLIDFIRDDPDIFLLANFSNLLQFFFRINHPCRIPWRVDNNRFCFACNGIANLLCRHFKLRCCGSFNMYRYPTRQFDLFRITHPIGRWNDDFITRIKHDLEHCIQNMLRANSDHNFLSRIA